MSIYALAVFMLFVAAFMVWSIARNLVRGLIRVSQAFLWTVEVVLSAIVGVVVLMLIGHQRINLSQAVAWLSLCIASLALVNGVATEALVRRNERRLNMLVRELGFYMRAFRHDDSDPFVSQNMDDEPPAAR